MEGLTHIGRVVCGEEGINWIEDKLGVLCGFGVDCITPQTLARFQKYSSYIETTLTDDERSPDLYESMDTVGCIVADPRMVETVSGVSSGGLWLRPPGRTGHASHFGCGCYSLSITLGKRCSINGEHEESVLLGTSASGVGETLIRQRLCERICSDIQSHVEARMYDEDYSNRHMKLETLTAITHTVLKRSFERIFSGVNAAPGSTPHHLQIGLVLSMTYMTHTLVWVAHSTPHFLVSIHKIPSMECVHSDSRCGKSSSPGQPCRYEDDPTLVVSDNDDRGTEFEQLILSTRPTHLQYTIRQIYPL